MTAVAYKNTPANSFSLGTFLLILVAGVLCNLSPAFITLLWGVALAITVAGVTKNRAEYIWYAIAASPVLEVLARVGKAPGVPYESGKYYLLFAIVALLLYHLRNRSPRPLFFTGKLIALLLLPSILVGLATFNLDQWVFNGLAIFELACLLIFISIERWDVEQFCKTLQYTLIPIIFTILYISLRSPNVNEVTYTLTANTETSGGFASNQVSTIIGLGVLILSLLLMLKRPFVDNTLLNYVLIGFFIFRGLLTFSRGGMLIAGIAILIAFLFKLFSARGSFLKFIFFSCLIAIGGYFLLNKVNNLTRGALFLRYEGETKGTWSGYREKSLNTVTAGRVNLVLTDLKIFRRNFLFGVGPGGAKRVRRQYDDTYLDFDVASHTEFSRLISEHGIGGLTVVLVLICFPVVWIRKQKMTLWKGISAALFIYALGTSTHSAMRTNVTSVYYALAAVPVYYLAGKKREPGQETDITVTVLPGTSIS